MPLGLAEKFNIMQQSPYDLVDTESTSPESAPTTRWSPSRYTMRATADDGRLILWNSYSGAFSVFPANQADAVRNLLRKNGFEAPSKGLPKYLHDRGFIVPATTNEYRRFEFDFGAQHHRTDRLEFFLLSSEDCNLRCKYCYEDFARGTMQPWVRNGIKQLVEARAPRLRSLFVSWFGGEPLYGFPAIEDLGPFFVAIAERHSLYYASQMTTNGYLLTPDVAALLLSWKVTSFQVTIDGPEESHNSSRPARDGGGTFSTIFSNLLAMRQMSETFNMEIRLNFDRKNHPQISAFLDTLECEFSGDRRFRLRFRAVGRWGGTNDKDLDTCGYDESVRLQQEFREEARRRGLSVTDDMRSLQGLGSQVCYAARPYNMIIGASGKVMKCTRELDKNERNVVGQIREDGTLELDLNKMAAWTEPAFEHDNQCKACTMLPSCQGLFCPQERFDHHAPACTPLRNDFKREMRNIVEVAAAKARRVKIPPAT